MAAGAEAEAGLPLPLPPLGWRRSEGWMTGVRIDTDALAEWSQVLDELPPLADEFDPVVTMVGSAGSPIAAELHHVNVGALRALAEVVTALDCLVDELRAGVTVVTSNYSRVDERVASIVDSSVRGH